MFFWLTIVLLSEAVLGFRNLGCYVDDVHKRDLRGDFTDMGYEASIQTCVKYCTNKGYKFAGVQHGTECYCGDRFGRYGRVSETRCNASCAADNAQRCGGDSKNTVYSTNFLGCWRESRTRVMPYIPYMMPDGNATVETCIQYCGRNGYKYAGAQFYNQCWCGYNYNTYGEVNKKFCDTPCKGDETEMCGGGYLNSVYDTGIECNCKDVSYPNNQ